MTDPVLQAALEGESPFLFCALRIAFPGYTLRVLDGSGELVIGGETYLGIDPVFGVPESVGQTAEIIGDDAPEWEFSFLPPDASAATTLASALMQGSQVQVMLGAFDPAANSLIGTPEQLFLGEIDVPRIDVSRGSRKVGYTAVGVFERLFELAEGERASDGWHQSIWPGQLGLEYMTGTSKNLYWGAKRPIGQQIGQYARGGEYPDGFDFGRFSL